MTIPAGALERLQSVPRLNVSVGVLLSAYTRFGIGGPAAVFAETKCAQNLRNAVEVIREFSLPHVLIGGGTNLVVADSGFNGVVLRFTGKKLQVTGDTIDVEAGAELQTVVDESIRAGLSGMHTMTRIPGTLGAAIYGNAGAYGHSIQEFVEEVIFSDGAEVRIFQNSNCAFRYRESVFKRQKEWIILAAKLRFRSGKRAELQKEASEIQAIRDAKYPPSMKCAGSIFKNCLFAELPISVQEQIPAKLVREGKVPSAWFLEQVDAKGLRRGDIQVAAYHANLIYNDGAGTAQDLVTVIRELKRRVFERFGFPLEEEVQYIGDARVFD